MNPIHLIWVIPLSACFGAFVMALFKGGSDGRDECYYCPFPCEHNK